MEEVSENLGFDLWNALELEWDWTELLDGTMTAAQLQETWKQSVQDALDAYYGGE